MKLYQIIRKIKKKHVKAIGNINLYKSTLKEEQNGKQTNLSLNYCIREDLLLGGLLTNTETWINITGLKA